MFRKLKRLFKKLFKRKKEISQEVSSPLDFLQVRECNQAGLHLIESFEGLYLKSYRCPAGVWTIGYGTIKYPNGQKVKHGERITKSQAEQYLAYEVTEVAVAIDNHLRKCRLTLTPNQFSALVSFAYNLGVGPVVEKSRTMGGALRRHDLPGMADAFLVYNKARVSGRLKTLAGLVRRRKAERALFLAP